MWRAVIFWRLELYSFCNANLYFDNSIFYYLVKSMNEWVALFSRDHVNPQFDFSTNFHQYFLQKFLKLDLRLGECSGLPCLNHIKIHRNKIEPQLHNFLFSSAWCTQVGKNGEQLDTVLVNDNSVTRRLKVNHGISGSTGGITINISIHKVILQTWNL